MSIVAGIVQPTSRGGNGTPDGRTRLKVPGYHGDPFYDGADCRGLQQTKNKSVPLEPKKNDQ